jgi:hypothetical protein
LFGDPYLQRLSGIYIRGQCEPFIAVAVATSLVLLAFADGRWPHLVASGIALAAAFWLKYNAAAYALPVAVAAWVWSSDEGRGNRPLLAALVWIGLGCVILTMIVLTYFAVNGALHDWRLATIDYNLRYSNETYEGPASVLRYLVTFPFERARIDAIWFLGGLGTLLLLGRVRSNEVRALPRTPAQSLAGAPPPRSAPSPPHHAQDAWRGPRPQARRARLGSTLVIFSWLLAAAASIAINGSRGLPNYFVQANPALALAASAGLATIVGYRVWVRYALGAILIAALWRVGSDTPVWGLRLASLPGLVENVRYDLQYVRGRIGRDDYLGRFSGQKHDALEIDRLVRDIRETTRPSDPIFVFGFSGGSICWKSERASSSRFFWSRPVIIGFAADNPSYGSNGLLRDLTRRPPVLVVLQKEEWRSRDFFMNDDRLRNWLESGYSSTRETPMFSVWRLKR